jgi:hypothetical protein
MRKSIHNPYYSRCKCGRLQKKGASMCRHCYNKWAHGKNGSFYGHKHSEESKEKMRNKFKGIKRSKKDVKAILNGMKRSKHHIYLRENSNEILRIPQSVHSSIHRFAYKYIYLKYGKKGINGYLKWFNKNIRRIF